MAITLKNYLVVFELPGCGYLMVELQAHTTLAAVSLAREKVRQQLDLIDRFTCYEIAKTERGETTYTRKAER